jgi:outer membrane protein assembly factor BamB
MRARVRWGVLFLLAGALAACSGGSSGPTCSFDDPAHFPGTPAPSGTPHPWQKFHYDQQNTGTVVNAKVASNPGTCLWVFPPGGPDSCSNAPSMLPKGAFAASPVISNDGSRIYIGSADNTLYALNAADGTQVASTDFSFSIAQPITSTALVAHRAEGEVVFVGAGDGTFYGLTSTGTAQPTNWPNGVGGIISGSPNIGADGTLYLTSLSAVFVGVCPNGITRFVSATAGSQSSPAQGPDGTLYFGTDDNELHAIQPTGTISWSFSASGPILTAPVFDIATNSIYVADGSGRVFKVETSGRLEMTNPPDSKPVFSFQLPPQNCPTSANPCAIRSSPAVAEDHLYFGSDDGNLYTINKCDGSIAWTFHTGGVIASSPAVAMSAPSPLTTCPSTATGDSERVVVFGSNDGRVYFLQDNGLEGNALWCFDLVTRQVITPCPEEPTLGPDSPNAVGRSSPAIGSDGTVYVGANDGRVYAIGAQP